MPSTTESGLTVKNTKINPSKFFGKEEDDGDDLGKVGQDGESKIGKLSKIGRHSRIKINDLEKRVDINAEKITRLKNITKLRKANVDKKMGGGELKGILGEIAGVMEGIKETLIAQNELDKDAAADARKANEKKKRGLGESALEATKNALQSAGEKVLAPVKNAFSKIFDFIKTIFLGRIAVKLWDWFSDPANADKVKSIFKFLKDWWPVIVAGIMAIVGPGITFAIGAVALLMWGVPKIIDAVKSVFGFGKEVDKELKAGSKQTEGDLTAAGDKFNKDMEAKINDSQKDQPNVDPVEDATPDKDAEQIPAQELNKGGEVKGTGDEDTVPAMLTPGEFVMNKSAVSNWGKDMLEGMNAAGGGAKTPSTVEKPKESKGAKPQVPTVPGFAGGGLIPNLEIPRFEKGGLVLPLIQPRGYAGGGEVKGKVKGPGGVDKVPAQLTAGEFVMSKGAVEKYGVDTLEGMNAAAGGTNIPTPMGGFVEGGKVVDMAKTMQPSTSGSDPKKMEKEKEKGGGLDEPFNIDPDKKYEKIEGLPELGGGGGGTDSLTEQAKVKTFGGAFKDILFGEKRMTEQDRAQELAGGGLVQKFEPLTGVKMHGGGVVPATRVKSEKKPQGFMRGLSGYADFLTGGVFDFDKRGGGLAGKVKLPLPKTKVDPPSRMKSTVAYGHIHEQEKGELPVLSSPSTDIPDFDAAAMNSQDKIRTLGITI